MTLLSLLSITQMNQRQHTMEIPTCTLMFIVALFTIAKL
jgi:hypothetical protein